MRTYFIAEAGLCHNGSVDLAKKMIDVAIKCGADAVKFQKRDVSSMATKDILDQPFTNFPSMGKTYREVREHLELTKEEYHQLRDYCLGKIDFIVTPFDIISVAFLDDLNVDGIKIAAHSLTDVPVLEEIAKRDKPVYLSTGMSTWEDIDRAVIILEKLPLTIMHCVSQYPMNVECANLPMISELEDCYPDYRIGWSDHQHGISLCVAGIALGAEVVEKHFTLDHTMEGFDHSFSLDPIGLQRCIRNIREMEQAMVLHEKQPMAEEMDCFFNYRRTIVSTQDIPKGVVITREMLTTKAPNRGLSPSYIPDLIGKKALVDIPADTHIEFGMVGM